MADTQTLLDHLDSLKASLDAALADKDWEKLVELNKQIKPSIEPLMQALENNEVDPEAVRPRLQALNEFVQAADTAAVEAREEARQSLQEINQNRNAAKAYQGVSSGRSK